MSRQYKFDNQTPEIKASGEVLKRVQSFKFLGMVGTRGYAHINTIVSLMVLK